MPKVSIITPVYKAEQYINRCIDSILAQTYTDWELLLIDDGSPDRSGEICDEYAARDNRIRVFHKENGGVSSARNLGLDNAKGEFIWFVDSDDWIECDALNRLLCEFGKNDMDICFFGLKPVSESNVPSPFSFDNICNDSHFKKFCGQQECAMVIPEIEMCGGMGWTWNKIFQHSIIKKNNIRFDTRFSIQEDHLFTLSYLLYVESVLVTNYAPYFYVISDGTLMSRSQSYENTRDRNMAMLESRNRLCIKHKIDDKQYVAWFMSDYATRSVANLTRLKESSLTYKESIQEINEINSFISNHHSVRLGGRTAYYRWIKWLPSKLLMKLL